MGIFQKTIFLLWFHFQTLYAHNLKKDQSVRKDHLIKWYCRSPRFHASLHRQVIKSIKSSSQIKLKNISPSHLFFFLPEKMRNISLLTKQNQIHKPVVLHTPDRTGPSPHFYILTNVNMKLMFITLTFILKSYHLSVLFNTCL